MPEEKETVAEPKPSRLPMILSAFVAPGAGQAAQRRWFAALFYGVGFMVCFIGVIVCAFRILIAYYGMAFDFHSNPSVRGSMIAGIWLFLAAVTLYLLNILDTWVAYRRACSRWTERRIESALKRSESEGGPRQ